ncbi:hypothetical protein HOC35_03925 [Candidatus Woesearchaeota archaeon]|nr:hypothetical protein [Candidatus Woesearchaeota archaeon]
MKFEIFKKKSKYLLFTLFVLTLLTIASCSSNQGPGKYDTFAKALTEEGVKMYGTEWCSHCKSQKELFGASFQYINYIDCDKESNICDAAEVKGFPTWEIDGRLYPGEQSFEELSLYSGVEFTEG